MLRKIVAVAGIVASAATPTAKSCTVEQVQDNQPPMSHSFNEDNGIHEMGPTGKWAWNHSYKPKGASEATCKWQLLVQKKVWKQPIRMAWGRAFDTVYVDLPEPGTRIWLKVRNCGRMVRVK